VSNPYTPVERSTARKPSEEFNPPDGSIVDLVYGQDGFCDAGFVVENNRNPYAWVDATDEDSFVKLSEME
jgi:hypothetical protein